MKLRYVVPCPVGPFREAIYLRRTRKVPDAVIDAVAEGIDFIIRIANAKIKIIDHRDWGINVSPYLEHQSVDWYQFQSALSVSQGFGNQIDGDRLLDLAQLKQDGNFTVMVVDRDMRGGGRSFVPGLAYDSFGFVMSPVRVLSPDNIKIFGANNDWIPKALSLIAAHEFAHVLGLVNRVSNKTHDSAHCLGERGDCLMQENVTRLMANARIGEWYICPDCSTELSTSKYIEHGPPLPFDLSSEVASSRQK
jgi:hypothetical protein